jgi:hypothetical protein
MEGVEVMIKYGNLVLKTEQKFYELPYSSRIGGFAVEYKGKDLEFNFLNASSSAKIIDDGKVQVEWDLSILDQDTYREEWKKLGISDKDLTAKFLTSLDLIDLYGGIYFGENAEKTDNSASAVVVSFSLRDENSDETFNFSISKTLTV